MISLSISQDSLHQCKSWQIISLATLCHFHGFPCTRISWKTTTSHSQETGPCPRTLWTLHQVCAWTREAERRNMSTPIPYILSTRTSGQTMRLQGLKWHFSLEWIQTNCKTRSPCKHHVTLPNLGKTDSCCVAAAFQSLGLHSMRWNTVPVEQPP